MEAAAATCGMVAVCTWAPTSTQMESEKRATSLNCSCVGPVKASKHHYLASSLVDRSLRGTRIKFGGGRASSWLGDAASHLGAGPDNELDRGPDALARSGSLNLLSLI